MSQKNIMYTVQLALVLLLLLSTQIFINIQVILLGYSVGLIYIGSIKSARSVFSHAHYLPGAISDKQNTQEKPESIQAKQAAKIPFYGAAILVGLYLFIKFIGKEYINYLLKGYFAFFGVASLKNWFYQWLELLSGDDPFTSPKSAGLLDTLRNRATRRDAYALMFAAIAVSYYSITNNWVLCNLIAMSFCIYAIQQMALPSFKIGAGLLWGLFFYDIFFVFGTDIMVTVARNIDGPIKLMVPRQINQDGHIKFSMLGLGDVIIPGIYMALCLRFDVMRWIRSKTQSIKSEQLTIADLKKGECMTESSKSFFNASIFGYIAGMVATIFVMTIFQAAQPALLYLVPGCVFSTLICGFINANFSEVVKYNEEEAFKEQKVYYQPEEDTKDKKD